MTRISHGRGELLGENTLLLVVPLTPSLNELLRWQRSGPIHLRGIRYTRARRQAQVAVNACVSQALGLDFDRPWATMARLRAVRCSDQARRIDPTNLRGGLKLVEDAIVDAGIIPDDGPKYVEWMDCEDRIESMWGELSGPATWIWIERIK